MVYLFIFISGMLFYGVVIPIISNALEYMETEKEVFVSNQSVTVAQNNSVIKKLQPDESAVSAIGFDCPSVEEFVDDDCEDYNAQMTRKVGF